MGVSFSACQAVVAIEDTREEAVVAEAKLKVSAQDIREEVAEERTALQQLAEDVAKAETKVEELIQAAKASVAEVVGGGETVQEAAEGVKDEAAAAEVAAKKVEGDAVVVEEKAEGIVASMEEAVAQVTDVVKHGMEAVEALMEAAQGSTEAVVMSLVFVEGKGTVHQLDFKQRTLGFALDRSGVGCCGKASKAKIVVKKVEKGGQADQLGVKRSWVLRQIDGADVTGLEQAQTLLTKGVAKLPEA